MSSPAALADGGAVLVLVHIHGSAAHARAASARLTG